MKTQAGRPGPVPLLHLWRISEHADLSGFGAEVASARWHTASPEKRVVYLTETTSTSILEVLVNLQARAGIFPDSYQLLGVSVTKAVSVATLERKEHSYDPLPDKRHTQQLGNAWLQANETALARVPAVVAPFTWNYLLNPRHPDAAYVKITSQRRLPFDPRLFQVRT